MASARDRGAARSWAGGRGEIPVRGPQESLIHDAQRAGRRFVNRGLSGASLLAGLLVVNVLPTTATTVAAERVAHCVVPGKGAP